MNNRFVSHLQISLAILDLLSLNIVFFLIEQLYRNEINTTNLNSFAYFGFFLTIAWFVISIFTNIYADKNIISFETFTRLSVYGLLYYHISICWYLYAFHPINVSVALVTVLIVGLSIGIILNRFVYLTIYQYFKKKDYLISKVVIIGYNSLSKKLVNYLEGDIVNKEIIGYCEEYKNVDELSRYPILSSIESTLEVCKKYGVSEIYCTIAPEQNNDIYDLIRIADENCIRFKIVPDIGSFIKKQVHLEYINEIPVLTLRKEPLEDLGNRIKKRGFDIVVSLLVLIFILSWLVPIIGFLIYLESKGPIFFTQDRSGKDNIPFKCLKFRSMKMNKESNDKQATKNDKRVTKIGKFLRRTSLDEFPQFINVIKGNMSIVGPRPHMIKHTDEYSRIINQYMVRQFLKPGITGWAQVNGFRGETKNLEQMQKRVEHDLWYMENWNFWLDLKIIFLTVFNTIKGEENAY